LEPHENEPFKNWTAFKYLSEKILITILQGKDVTK
jgi:hypothetical protein